MVDIQDMIRSQAAIYVAIKAHERDLINFREVRAAVTRATDLGRPLRSLEVQELCRATLLWVQQAKSLMTEDQNKALAAEIEKAEADLQAKLLSQAVEALPHVCVWVCPPEDDEDFSKLAGDAEIWSKEIKEIDAVLPGVVLEVRAPLSEFMDVIRELGLDITKRRDHLIAAEALQFPHRKGEIKAAIERVRMPRLPVLPLEREFNLHNPNC